MSLCLLPGQGEEEGEEGLLFGGRDRRSLRKGEREGGRDERKRGTEGRREGGREGGRGGHLPTAARSGSRQRRQAGV